MASEWYRPRFGTLTREYFKYSRVSVLTAGQIALTSDIHFNAIRLVVQVLKKKIVAAFSRLTQSSA